MSINKMLKVAANQIKRAKKEMDKMPYRKAVMLEEEWGTDLDDLKSWEYKLRKLAELTELKPNEELMDLKPMTSEDLRNE